MGNKQFFYSDDYFNLIFKKKQNVNIIVPKFLIRHHFLRSGSLVIENYSTLFSIYSRAYKRLKRLQLLQVGRMLYENIFFYKGKYLSFKSIGFKQKIISLVQIRDKKYKMYKRLNTFLYLYKKVEGGYLGFSCGFLGFISRKHFYLALTKLKFPYFLNFYVSKLKLLLTTDFLSFRLRKKRKIRRRKNKRLKFKQRRIHLFYNLKYIFRVELIKKKFLYFINQ